MDIAEPNGETMRIWTTVIGQRLDDAENTRSMLLCAALLARGHEVTMWTSSFDHINKRMRVEWQQNPNGFTMASGLNVRFMEGCGYKDNISLRRFVDHWLAGRSLKAQAARTDPPDIIIASVPDHLTADAARDVAKSTGAALVVDVRDKWPDIFVDYTSGPLKRKVIGTALAYERHRVGRALRSADSIVGMMQSMLDWGLQKAGHTKRDQDRVFYLTTADKNLPEGTYAPLPATSKIPSLVSRLRDKIVFSFTGTFNKTQHPLLLMDALDELRQSNGIDFNRTAFVIGGAGVEFDEVERRASKHRNVHITGWLTSEEMRTILRVSDVGLLLMNFPSPAFNNKAFSYLATGLPIINGATGDLAELIAERRMGINVAGGSVGELAAAITQLAGNPRLLADMNAASRAAYAELFDRTTNYDNYASHIEAIADASRKSRLAGV